MARTLDDHVSRLDHELNSDRNLISTLRHLLRRAERLARSLDTTHAARHAVGAADPLAGQFVPLTTPLTSTSWDGDAKTVADNGTIDLSAVFGAPVGIKAALVVMTIYDETPGVLAAAGALNVWTQVANIATAGMGVVPCDANGDFAWACTEELDYVKVELYGYWMGL
jgi:hypothetical protein